MGASRLHLRLAPVAAAILAATALAKAPGAYLSFSSAGASPAPSAPPSGEAAPVQSKIVEAAPLAPADSAAARHIAETLARRQAELETRSAALETRERLLEAAEARLTIELARAQAEVSRLEALRTERETATKSEFQELSRAYERMKPREAARIFEILGDDILVPVAAGMRTQALAATLAEMKPERAEALTRALSEIDPGVAAPTRDRGAFP